MRHLLVIFLLAIDTVTLARGASTLLGFGSTWRYLDDGSDQGAAWRQPGFNDSAWASGPAELGYGDGDEATVTSFIDADPITSGVQKNATTYFRTTFDVPDPSQLTSLSLTVRFDDAAAVYINGNEVARTSNLAANAASDTYAASTSSDNQTQTWTLSPSALQLGLNLVAVEIHQASGTSSDISFDLQLLGTSQVTRGPYLQLNNEGAVTLCWRTQTATDSVVHYGTTQGAPSATVTDATSTTEHSVRVTGLLPDTQYFYAVGSSAGVLAGGQSADFFRTAPVAGTDRPTRIWVLGDCGTANSNQAAVRDAYYQSPAYAFNDLILLLGDNAYNTGTDTEYQNAVFGMYFDVLRQSPVWSCLGNHETAQATSGSYGGVPYFDIFTFPTAAECGGSVSGTERYFSWEFGNIHFISLDTQTTDATLRANMLTWLENDLAANQRRWTIACWHHPPYTKGSHNSDTEGQLIWARENLVPRLEAAGVDLVLTGHSHSYERSFLIDGFYATPTSAASGTIIDSGDGRESGDGAYGKDYGAHQGAVYAVAGSSGQISGGALNHPVMFTSLNQLGSLILDVDGNRIDAQFLNSNGAVTDWFTLEKGPIVTLSSTDTAAAEFGPDSGTLLLTRSGSTGAALPVSLNIGGSALNGQDYDTVVLPVQIPVGVSSTSVTIQPMADSLAEGDETATFSVTPSVDYRSPPATPIVITIADLPADSWRFANFGSDANTPEIAGDESDPDADGLSNLLEYVLDDDPLFPTTAPLPGAEITSGYLTLTVERNPQATDVLLEVQVTDDVTDPGTWTGNDTTVLEDTPALLKVRDNIPVASSPHRFIRLEVTRETP